jgi:hypothetical protein
MSKPRIFISHSAKEPYARRFKNLLCAALKKAEFDVLVDEERLKEGVNWRDEIYTWMGLCHGAVILLSESACRNESIWVPRESSILLWRRTLQPDFILLPVYLGSVTPEDIKAGNFTDLNLHEVQATPSGEPEQVVRSIVARLEALKHEPQPTALERVADQVAVILRQLAPRVIEAAADELDVELGPWGAGDNPFRRLALKMLQVNLKEVTRIIEGLLGYGLEEAAADRLLALVAPSWVDLCAARWIPECIRPGDTKPIILLNASYFYSADMYVRRASCQPPKTSWPVFPFSGVFGEGAEVEMISEVENILIRAFRVSKDPFDDRSLKEILVSLLESRDERGKPVFVVLRFTPELAEKMAGHLPALQRALPSVNFFLLTGDDLPAGGQLDPLLLRPLEPRLAPGAERQAWNDYEYARSVIRPTVDS